jgi:hypothetical protein
MTGNTKQNVVKNVKQWTPHSGRQGCKMHTHVNNGLAVPSQAKRTPLYDSGAPP